MSRRESIAFVIVACALALGALSVGCRQSSTKDAQADNRPPAEKSFDEIALIIKGALETGAGGVQGGFVSEQPNARSHFSVHNTVTSDIIPPKNPGESYRAAITVKSHTSYSLRRIPEAEKKSSEKEKQKNGGPDSGSSPLDDSQGVGANGEVLDDSLISSSSKGTRPLPGRPEDSVARLADEEERTYELAYENGRWALKTPLDLKTELSVKNAFDYALKLQP
jgi:hypothetical protein